MNKIKYPSVEDVVCRWKLYFGYDCPRVEPVPMTWDQAGEAIVSVGCALKKIYGMIEQSGQSEFKAEKKKYWMDRQRYE